MKRDLGAMRKKFIQKRIKQIKAEIGFIDEMLEDVRIVIDKVPKRTLKDLRKEADKYHKERSNER